MHCPSCGVKNEDGALKCFVCGKILSVRPEAVPGRRTAARPKAAIEAIAGIGDRMIAFMLDLAAVLMVGGACLLMIAHGGKLLPRGLVVNPGWQESLLMGSAIAFTGLLYFWLCEWLLGATLGKALIGIKVRTLDGEKPSVGAALIRTLFRILDGLGFYFVGFVVAIFTRRRQRIGDLAARTFVVQGEPGTLIRALSLIIWVSLVAGSAFAVWTTVPPVRNGVANILAGGSKRGPAQTLQLLSNQPQELTLTEFTWLSSPSGPARGAGSFKPRDRSWARYGLAGLGRDEEGYVNLVTESVAVDPTGVIVERPTVFSFHDSLESDQSLRRIDPLRIPEYAPAGRYEYRIRVRDLSKNQEEVFVRPFNVDAVPSLAARVLEIRNFVFSTAADGFPIEPPTFDVGETVHYRYEIHGLQLLEDRVDWEGSYKLTGPDGTVLMDKPSSVSSRESYRYHPPSFFVSQSGTVSLPSTAQSGVYTQEHLVTDKIANATTTYVSKFKFR